IQSSNCVESGVTESIFCHKMASNSSVSTDTHADGDVTAAGCAAGFGCVQKSCILCACGLSVSVSVQGTSVSFGTSGEPEWTGNLQASMTCGVCHGVPPPPPPPGGGGGGGTGGGGGGGGCTAYSFDCGNDGSIEFSNICVGGSENPADVGCSLCYGT